MLDVELRDDFRESATTEQHWPAESQLSRDPDRLTPVIFAHPHRSCTRATIVELAQIRARCPDLVDVHVAFFRPLTFPVGGERSVSGPLPAILPVFT